MPKLPRRIQTFDFFAAGSSETAVVEEEDDGPEFEEEELESVQISETEFNFLDFIKR